MDRIRDELHVALSAPSTSVLAEGALVGKPLEEEPEVMNGRVVCGLHVTRAFLDVAVVSVEGGGGGGGGYKGV